MYFWEFYNKATKGRGALDETEFPKVQKLFFEISEPTSPLDILFGEELGWPELTPAGIIATHFNVRGKPAMLAIIGPSRVSYSTLIPVVKYFKGLIEEVASA